jgi:hypothetical protein
LVSLLIYKYLNYLVIDFSSFKYIRIDVETDPADLVHYLYHVDGWNLNEPSLILSVIGSTKRFDIPKRIRKAFKQGLIKVATSTGAWIITYGTTTGVTKLVSEIVSDEPKNDKLILIGMAQWGKTSMREKLIVTMKLLSNNDSY